MLIVGALLMAAAGLVFASTSNFWLLVLAGTIGVISPSGNEVGPFLSIEQAALSHVVTDRDQDGSVRLVHARRVARDGARRACRRHRSPACCSRRVRAGDTATGAVVMLYAALGVVLAVLFSRLSPAAEAATRGEQKASQRRSRAFPDSTNRATS